MGIPQQGIPMKILRHELYGDNIEPTDFIMINTENVLDEDTGKPYRKAASARKIYASKNGPE